MEACGHKSKKSTNDDDHKKQEETRKDFGLSFQKWETEKEYISVVFSHPVCGKLLWPPQEN